MTEASAIADGIKWNGRPVSDLYRSAPPSNPDHWQRCPACRAPMRWDLSACTGSPRHLATVRGPRIYASRTGTRRNLAAMTKHGYRLLATPSQRYGEPLPPWAFGLDNGAWTAHQQGTPFDAEAYRATVGLLGGMADWVAVPDVVGGGMESLAMSLDWLPELMQSGIRGPLLVPVQDGMTTGDVERAVPLGARVGLFVGGFTKWKEATMSRWAAFAREAGAWCHVGRVNTARRMALVVEAGADSCDGTTATQYAIKAPGLAFSALQGGLPLVRSESPCEP